MEQPTVKKVAVAAGPVIGVIGALIAAAKMAADLAISAVAGQSVSAVIINNTPFNMVRYMGIWEPKHGSYVVSPGETIPSLLNGAKKEGSNTVFKEENNTSYSLKSRGSGTEVVTVYRIEELNKMVAFYLGNPVTGAAYAGVSISDQSWFQENVNKNSKDQKGDWMRDHIKDIHTKLCQYSQNGKPKSVELDQIKITFDSAVEEHFTIHYTGSWDPYIEEFKKRMHI